MSFHHELKFPVRFWIFALKARISNQHNKYIEFNEIYDIFHFRMQIVGTSGGVRWFKSRFITNVEYLDY